MTDHKLNTRKKMEAHAWSRTQESIYSGLTILLNYTLSLSIYL